MDTIMAANQVGNVLELYISQKDKQTRTPMEKITLENGGVNGDKFFQKDDKREVLLASIDSYILAEENGIRLEKGALGENILIDYNPYKLAVGTKLQIGTVIFEISLYCPICNHLSKVEKGLPKLLRNDRGIFAKVIKSGSVSIKDRVYLL